MQKATIISLFNIFWVKCTHTFSQKAVLLYEIRPKGREIIPLNKINITI